MGTNLTDVSATSRRLHEPPGDPREGRPPEEQAVASVAWLDNLTAGLVRAIVITVAEQHPELRAAILYGSVARHEERPIDDREPSDVDLLLLFDVPEGQADIPHSLYRAIFASIGEARQQYLYPPREVHALPVVSICVGGIRPSLRTWRATASSCGRADGCPHVSPLSATVR